MYQSLKSVIELGEQKEDPFLDFTNLKVHSLSLQRSHICTIPKLLFLSDKGLYRYYMKMLVSII